MRRWIRQFHAARILATFPPKTHNPSASVSIFIQLSSIGMQLSRAPPVQKFD
jgi:hypothetical protein